MRVVMFGYQTWGHRTLQALLDSEHEVVLVVTHPKSEHAYEKIWSDSVADLADEHGVPVLIRNRPDDDELFERAQGGRPGHHRGQQLAHLDPAAHLRPARATAR